MEQLSEQSYDDLEPRRQPYEVRVEVDMAMRIFPNGSKTWVHIFCDGESVQRATLGIYPEMSLDEAYQALEKIRAAHLLFEQVPEQQDIHEKKVCDFDEFPAHPSGAQRRLGRISMLASCFMFALVATAYNLPNGNHTSLQPQVQALQTPELTSHETSVAPVAQTEPMVSADPVAAPLEKIESAVAPKVVDLVQLQKAVDEPVEDAVQETGWVKRAQFTSGIKDREPVDRLNPYVLNQGLVEGVQQLYFFTEVTQLEGRTVYHRWELDGEVVAEIPFQVKSNWRWRVYSSKQILPTMSGDWRVSVVDDEGGLLYSEQFTMGSDAEQQTESVAMLE